MCVCIGLQRYLNEQGFHIVGYGCTTCIGNSGELDESVASAISENGISVNMFIQLFNEFINFVWKRAIKLSSLEALWKYLRSDNIADRT